jgi:RNA polymerase sigma factor (sigma-70 family)
MELLISEEKLTDEYVNKRNEVILDHMKMVYKVANKYCSSLPNASKEDLIQVGVLALMQSYDKWDPNGGKKFSSFAYWNLKSCMISEFRLKKHERDCGVAISGDIIKHDDSDLTIFDTLSIEKIEHSMLADHKMIHELMEKVLSEREQYVLTMKFGLKGEELTYDEIGERYKIAVSTVCAIAKKALYKLKKHL